MIPNDEPLMQHYMADGPGALAVLPPVTPAAVRSFNEQVRHAEEEEGPEYATVFAGFGFEKAYEHCAEDEDLLSETAELLLRVFLSHERPIALRAVTTALERTGVGHPFDRYRVYVRVTLSGEALLDRGFGKHCLGEALHLAEAIHEDEPDHWQPLAQARLLTAASYRDANLPGRAAEALYEAVSLCRRHSGGRDYARLLTWALQDQGRLLLDAGDVGEAQRALTECESILDELLEDQPEPWASQRMCLVLMSQAELVQRQGDPDGARDKLTRAVDLSTQGPMMLEAHCRFRLAKLLVDTGRETEAADVLFELSGTYLLLGAAFADAADVLDLAKVEAEDEGWTHGTHPEGEEQLTLHQRRLRDAERLLNLSPELGARRIRGLERSLRRGSSDDPERDPAQRQRLTDAWRALGLIRRVALDVCSRRADLADGWIEGFPAQEVSFGCCRFSACPVDSGDAPTAWRVIAEIGAAPERRVDPVSEVIGSIVDAIAHLLEQLPALPDKAAGRAARRLVHWSFAFKSLDADEALILERFHRDAPLSDYQIGGPLYPDEFPARLPGMPADPDEWKRQREWQHYREQYGLTVRQVGGAAGGDQLNRRVAHVFELVMQSMTEGRIALRWCQAPTSKGAYLLWKLGEVDEIPVCGRFYFGNYGPTQACGTNHSNLISKLRNSTQKQLWNEAETIAFREFKQSGVSGAALPLWEKVCGDHSTNSAEALAAFRSLIARASKK